MDTSVSQSSNLGTHMESLLFPISVNGIIIHPVLQSRNLLPLFPLRAVICFIDLDFWTFGSHFHCYLVRLFSLVFSLVFCSLLQILENIYLIMIFTYLKALQWVSIAFRIHIRIRKALHDLALLGCVSSLEKQKFVFISNIFTET